MRIERLFISHSHNYFGHHGQPAGTEPMIEVAEAKVVAGCGIVGDRFYDFKPDYKGQVTFFSREVYESLCAELQVWDRQPSVFRRNILTSGVDLNSLIGKRFEVQGLEFEGIAECSPCHWMEEAFHTGAEQALQGRGGLRAKVIRGGSLRAEVALAPAL